MQCRVVRVLGAQRRHIGAVEERPGAPLARVAEPPHVGSVRGQDGHLDREPHAVPLPHRLHESDRPRHGGGRVVLQPEGQREEEEQLGVRAALDLGVAGGVHGQREVTLENRKPGGPPLCANNHEPLRKGWQLVCWTGVPVEARMCATTAAPRCARRARRDSGRSTPAPCCGTAPVWCGRRTSRRRNRHRWSSRPPAGSASSAPPASSGV